MGLEAFGLPQSDLARLLTQTGWVARIVLVILLAFSIFSWAIIFRKYSLFRRAREASDNFLGTFRSATKFPELPPLVTRCATSPLLRVYAAGIKELESQAQANPHGGKRKKQ